MEQIKIGKRIIGEEQPCFIIAEAGSNHDRDINQAKALIDLALEAGADAVKFQTFTADKIAANTNHAIVRLGNEYEGVPTLYELYKGLELPRDWQMELAHYAVDKGIMFLSTPFDRDAVDELDELGMPAYKVASFEMVDLPFLKCMAKRGKPVILSTGMATMGEIEEALTAIYSSGNKQVILLHCGISYPMPYSEVNLKAIETMRLAFQVPVGYSDHSLGISVPLAAVALGAKVIEKHFTLDKKLKGPDHKFALDPGELKDMVRGIREVEAALGSPVKGPTPAEELHRARGRRSIFSRVDIPRGTVINEDMLAVLRPGIGLKPKYLEVVTGRKAQRDIKANEPITWDEI
ncbi:MAG: pseudaminic acid synthase [Carboxydocellales bacterium]